MEKLSHAYIVSSDSVVAGREKALLLAQKMLCSSPGKRPCGVCRDCRKVLAGVHPDLMTVRRLQDDKGNTKRDIQIDQIRDMGADAYVLPNEAQGKVYIVEEAETMNERAQNAALKLFEEPPVGVSFILCTANPEKLLITVRSRCVEIRCNAEESAEDEETAKLADEFVACLDKGSTPELTAWCMEHEKLDQRKTAEFLNCLKRRLADRLKNAEDRKTVMENIRLVDRCLEYQTVNTGVRHIFGLLAARAGVETRK